MLRAGGRLDADGRRAALEAIERNARPQTQLIEDLLDVSRIIAGKLRLERAARRPAAPSSQAAIDAVRPAADAKGIRARSSCSSPTPAPVVGRPGPPAAGRLEPALERDQVHAARAGACTSRLGRRELARRDRRQRHRRRDHAASSCRTSSTASARRTLEHDARARRPRARPRDRPPPRRAARRHASHARARARARARPSRVRLPLDRRPRGAGRAPRAHHRARAIAALRPRAVCAAVRVLVVDDEPDTPASWLAISLARVAGAEVSGATSARGRRSPRSRTRPPDVLLSDIEMPGEDGYALIRRVQGARRRSAAAASPAAGAHRVRADRGPRHRAAARLPDRTSPSRSSRPSSRRW